MRVPKRFLIEPDPPAPTPRFTRDQPVWWQRRSNEEPLEATFVYYTKNMAFAVIDVEINGRNCRKFASHQSLSERTREEQLLPEREQIL